jgi:iron(III) transport system substrate-binding protein
MATDRAGAPPSRRRRLLSRGAVALVVVLLLLSACGGADTGAGAGATDTRDVTLYTCLSDETVQQVITAFEQGRTGRHVRLFRGPTGQLNARVAADERAGGLRADVVWGCDPLTVQAWVDAGLVGGWTPSDVGAVPEEFRTKDYVGAHVLYMVAVHRTDAPAPTAWSDLADADHTVAVPDPGVAASALGALGYFAAAPDYGMDFYQRLHQNGAVQVGTPDDVTTGVAQGVYDAGMTTAQSAYAAKDAGSPVDVVWPQPGAIAIYGPIAIARHSADSRAAQDFISFVVSEDGQRVIGSAGSYPASPDVPGPTIPEGAPVVFPDWAMIGKDKDAVLAEYRQIFGA